MATAIEAVERGASLLDERRPGWYREINIAQLNIAQPAACICGQLYGGYWQGLAALGVGKTPGTGKTPSDYGFNTLGAVALDDLTSAWRDEIARRRLSEVPVPTVALTA